jgi:hypothetical protein
MSVIYKRTERDREWETGSSRGGSGAGYTTVRRYKVPDHSLEEDTYESEMRLVHRGRDDYEDRRSVKEYTIEREHQPAKSGSTVTSIVLRRRSVAMSMSTPTTASSATTSAPRRQHAQRSAYPEITSASRISFQENSHMS